MFVRRLNPRWLPVLGLVTIVACAETSSPGRRSGVAVRSSEPAGKVASHHGRLFQPQRLFSRPFAVIDKLECLPAEQAERRIDDVELVLGVTIAGEARAYPINMLFGPAREFFNDTLGGRAIAATW